MTWVYRHTERSLWTVGLYTPDGRWEPESDHASEEGAAQRVHYLNGGSDSINRDLLAALERIRTRAETDPANLPIKMFAGEIAAMCTAAIAKANGG